MPWELPEGGCVLDGGSGNGNDTLIGGAGADVFVIRAGSGHDTIRDFGPGDRVVLERGLVPVEDDWGQSGGSEPSFVWVQLGTEDSIFFDAVWSIDLRAFDYLS